MPLSASIHSLISGSCKNASHETQSKNPCGTSMACRTSSGTIWHRTVCGGGGNPGLDVDPGYADRTTNGNGWVDTQQPYCGRRTSGAVIVVVDGYKAIEFDRCRAGTLGPLRPRQLTHGHRGQRIRPHRRVRAGWFGSRFLDLLPRGPTGHVRLASRSARKLDFGHEPDTDGNITESNGALPSRDDNDRVVPLRLPDERVEQRQVGLGHPPRKVGVGRGRRSGKSSTRIMGRGL